ncbi:hypothetical protein Q9L42_014760 [Methylomarinum sp. Ch1-1]|uniref:Permease n=1 Tax=Methylomarinum roseum TaxID=3067653 RepID=A0AAU7NRM6_9GAMM|nr:hypothetical protein [Methylomarinum sp. Ch1-1]MDP4520412.1 hypothetical protein [Methylomarinum sp. Ch1-1]
MRGEQQKNRYHGWTFLVLVLFAYGLVGILNPEASIRAPTFFRQSMGKLIPVLGLIFLLLLIANLVVDPKRISRYLGKQSGLQGWGMAVIGGIVSMGPIYAWYALLSELRQKGMREALIATFLCSRAIKPPLLPLMIHYFGVTYTWVLCLYLIIFAVINGLLVERLSLH